MTEFIRLVLMIIVWGTVIIASIKIAYNGIIDRMNLLSDTLLHSIDSLAGEVRHGKKDEMARIDDVRNRVLYTNDTYETNDVLDIIDEITDIIEKG